MSTYVFNGPDVSFFQYVMGLFSAFDLYNKVKCLNTAKNMERFIMWWTGANLDRSE